MSSITIRRLPTATKEKLRRRAVAEGLSLEAYTRRVLQTASETIVEPVGNLADLAKKCFGERNGVDLELPARGTDRPPLPFD